MKKIVTHGITNLEPLDGSWEWYWGTDYIHGDLYEAQELYQDHHPVQCNRLVFVHYPDGRIVEPVKREAGCYFGRPISYHNTIQILVANFPKASIHILQYNDALNQVTETASLSLTEVGSCYNLLLYSSPLMLTRQENDGRFQMLWPEKVEFEIGENESFYDRKKDKLYFCRWQEDPVYQEEIVIRAYPTGEILEVFPGSWITMPDGQIWVLQ